MNERTKLLIWFLFTLAIGTSPISAQQQTSQTTNAQASSRHQSFTQLLDRYVNDKGRVDYQRLRQNAEEDLVPYLKQLSDTDPSKLSRKSKIAFWLNAYNAYALKLIVDNYPVKNIWATTASSSQSNDQNSPFLLKLGPVADTARSLDEIEHNILRKRFEEPRIHFAVVCPAENCPPLRTEAYTGPQLYDQLDDQARTFLHSEAQNRIPAGGDRILLNPILKWFRDDFGPSNNALQKYISKYYDGQVKDRLESADYEVSFREFDWSLNAQE